MNPPPFTDLHSHLVPGVDDGSASVEESLDSLAALRAEGVTALVTTPHLLLPRLATDAAIDRELLVHRRAFDELAEAALDRTDLPAIGLGGATRAPDAAQIRRVVRRMDVGLGRGHYLLVEFGFDLQGKARWSCAKRSMPAAGSSSPIRSAIGICLGSSRWTRCGAGGSWARCCR